MPTALQQVAALPGVELTLAPYFLSLELQPEVSEIGADKFRKLWHRTEPRKVGSVIVASTDGKAHKVRLHIEGADSKWQTSWTCWELLLRKARELEGGDALDAQDEVSADGQTLTAMIKAGETRTFSLQLCATLDGDTQPGIYAFDIVARSTSVKEPGEARQSGYLKLDHPTSKFLDHLPALYTEEMDKMRAEEGGASPFFERFLLGFEDSFKPLQKTLDRMDQLFGPYSAPSEFLIWLGAWVCVPLDENWPEMKRRSLIREAVELYRWRGTKRGLSRYIEIYTGVVPEINDLPVKGMRLGPETKMGAKLTILGDVPGHTFVVTVATPNPESLNEQVIHDIITYEKPAHTAYSLRLVKRTA